MSVRILGNTTSEASNMAADYLHAGRYEAVLSGTITEIRVYCGTSGNVKIAILDDDSGEPGDVLVYNDNPQSVSSGQWNTLSIPELEVTEGIYYWIIHLSDTSGAVRRSNTDATGDRRYKAETYSGFVWADYTPGGWNSHTTDPCTDAWGDEASAGGLLEHSGMNGLQGRYMNTELNGGMNG